MTIYVIFMLKGLPSLIDTNCAQFAGNLLKQMVYQFEGKNCWYWCYCTLFHTTLTCFIQSFLCVHKNIAHLSAMWNSHSAVFQTKRLQLYPFLERNCKSWGCLCFTTNESFFIFCILNGIYSRFVLCYRTGMLHTLQTRIRTFKCKTHALMKAQFHWQRFCKVWSCFGSQNAFFQNRAAKILK